MVLLGCCGFKHFQWHQLKLWRSGILRILERISKSFGWRCQCRNRICWTICFWNSFAVQVLWSIKWVAVLYRASNYLCLFLRFQMVGWSKEKVSIYSWSRGFKIKLKHKSWKCWKRNYWNRCCLEKIRSFWKRCKNCWRTCSRHRWWNQK